MSGEERKWEGQGKEEVGKEGKKRMWRKKGSKEEERVRRTG